MTLVKLSTLSVVFFSLLTLFVQSVLACSPGPSDPWFSTTLTFDESTVPIGVEIIQTDQEYEPYAVINRSSEPFYLIDDAEGGDSSHNFQLSDTYSARYKLVSGQVYFWGQRSSKDAEGWLLNTGGVNNSAASQVGIDESIYTLEEESKQIHQDNRPETVEIPDPQSFAILGFYKDQPVKIEGIISYALNDQYDPQAQAKGVEACSQWNEQLQSSPLEILLWNVLYQLPWVIIITVLSLLVLLIIKLTKGLRKK